MDTMMARTEMARRYEDVADGMQLAQLLSRTVRVHVRAWLGGLPQGIEEWIAGLRSAGRPIGDAADPGTQAA